jgi:hypothetical protein
VQLANQRQAREEAMAQRQEEARMRGQYYQDLVNQRREAAALAATGRNEALAIKFGRYLKRDKDGAIDIVGSAAAQEDAGNRNQFLETIGFAETQGIPIPGVELTPEERKSEFYNRGRAQGIVQKTKDDFQFKRIMASQGLIPGGARTGALPDAVNNYIAGDQRDMMLGPTGGMPAEETTLDILAGRSPGQVTPEALAQAPDRTIEVKPPVGMEAIKIGPDTYFRKLPKTQVVKADRPNTVNILDEMGKVVATRKLTDEAFAAWEATQPPGGAPTTSATNAAPTLPNFTFDKSTLNWIPSR